MERDSRTHFECNQQYADITPHRLPLAPILEAIKFRRSAKDARLARLPTAPLAR